MDRKLFGTDGIRGQANKHPMTPEVMLMLGKAIAMHFSNDDAPRIIIGKDTRISGYMLETALTSGLVSMGATVMLVGPVPTPAISHLTRSFNADAGIMISASHNPAGDNGIKIFDSRGFKLSDIQEQQIEQLMEKNIPGKTIGKAFRVDDARGRYIEFAKSSINNLSLEGLKIVVDCANGAAYKVAPAIFSELGAQTFPINDMPDGHNINKNCGALHTEHLSKTVIAKNADIGIALDGDADRLIIVDSKGKTVDGDFIIACLAADLAEQKRLVNNTVVATVMSNYSFEEFLNSKGIKVIRAKVGDRYVIEEMSRLGLNFGGEQSGHIIYRDYSTTGDGIITALQILRLMKIKKMPVSELCRVFRPYPQVLLNVSVREKIPFEQMKNVEEQILKAQGQLRGRVLVRYSGTENIARVMAEGRNLRKVKLITKKIADAIRKEIGA